MTNETFYRIALMTCKGMTCKRYRRLVSHCGSAQAVFELDTATLTQLMGGKAYAVAKSIEEKESLPIAEREMSFVERNKIDVLHFTDDNYPQRLNAIGCEDTPPLLYFKGNANLNAKHVLAIVGSRKATSYGITETMRLIDELKHADDLLIVSGLAYGIDTVSHKASLDNGVCTIGVLGHGLDQLYPPENRGLARRMVDNNGGLLSEYPSHMGINKNQFPARNRIVAALSDATVVIEANEHGGALITAQMALGYKHKVFAVPGRNGDATSQGCNNLIAEGKARMVRSARDITTSLGWGIHSTPNSNSLKLDLFESLSPNEELLIKTIEAYPEITMNELIEKTNLGFQETTTALLSLELKNRITSLAGKKYKAV